MATLSPAERTSILFAAQVIDAEVHGRRTSQASADLRAILADSQPPRTELEFSRGFDYRQIGDYCTGPDENED